MLDPIELLEEYYLPHTKAYKILRRHSEAVAKKSVSIATALRQRHKSDHKTEHNPEYAAIDIQFIYQAAMLHDIGMFATYAPSLGCFGMQPYLCHGIVGYNLLMEKKLPRHASVCKNHIGVGLTAHEIVEQKLPLPAHDFVPQNIEEQIITYADLFFSKNPTRLELEKTAAEVRRSLVSYGARKGEIFDRWHAIFSPPQ